MNININYDYQKIACQITGLGWNHIKSATNLVVISVEFVISIERLRFIFLLLESSTL